MKLKLDSAAKRRNLMATSVMAGVAAFGAPAAVMLAAAMAPSAVLAQDYTSGSLVGHVTDSSGAPVGGAAVTVRSQSTGVTQNSVTDSTGTFRAPLIPTGAYSVTIRKAGFTDIAQEGLSVRIGGESNYGFTLTNPNDLSEVVVVAKKPQPQLDFSQTTKGVAIDVEQLQKQVPIARNVTAIALLAPGVITAVPGFTNTDGSLVPSIGGASAGENAFFINGLNITNFDTYVGAATVPFDFYKTIEIKTGGYPAEFGRATGGVVNAVSKSGTNDLYFAIHGNYQPDALRELVPNTYGTNNARRQADSAQTSVEFGGPLWRDHLFFYGLYQFNNSVTASAGNLTGVYSKAKNTSPFYGYKIDAYLTSRQHFEFTDFNTAQTTTQSNSLFTAPANNFLSTRITNTGVPQYVNGGDAAGTIGAGLASTTFKSGGNNYVAKYTGTFTDWFTLSGAYGKNHDENFTLPSSTTASYVQDARATGTSIRLANVPSANASSNIDTTEREFYRVDADLYANFLGRHHFRVGYDHEDTDLFHSSFRSGGAIYTYSRIRTAGQSAALGLPLNQEYVRVEVANFGNANVNGTNESYYLQDSWDVTRRLNVQLGVRDDVFDLSNLLGQRAVHLTDNFAPRVALSYDPFGNNTDKLSFSYGRYYIPPASNLSFRGADLYYRSFYLPPGGALSFGATSTYPAGTGASLIDPATGKPTALGTLLTANNNPTFAGAQGLSACPVAVTGATPGTAGRVPGCVVFGDGTQEPAASKTALDLKATHEDEFIVGYQKKLNNLWTVSANVTYRVLGDVSEDIAIDTAIIKYCARNKTQAGCNDPNLGTVFGGDSDYVVANPGKDIRVKVRTDLATALAGQNITLLSSDLGNPKAKREYYALELAFDRAFDGKWSLNGSYTLSKLAGNYEGTVKSDAGNTAQTDAGSTQDFDHPGLEDGAYGLLPNHRAHQIKLYGSYQVLHNLLVGANMQVTSPRHYGCIGDYGGTADALASEYDPGSRYCINPTSNTSQLVPRGTAFEGDWFYQLDLSARFTVPKFNKNIPGDIVLRADVFNIFNSQQVIQYDEVGDVSGKALSGTYMLPLSYQTPRYVRFGFDLVF